MFIHETVLRLGVNDKKKSLGVGMGAIALYLKVRCMYQLLM